MLRWHIADEDSEEQDAFVLEANGEPLSKLDYLSPTFKLVEADPIFFDAGVSVKRLKEGSK